MMSVGSGCGSVGRAVASDTRGPRFESSHRRNFIMNMFTNNCWKDENKEKEAENGPFFLKKWCQLFSDTSPYIQSIYKVFSAETYRLGNNIFSYSEGNNWPLLTLAGLDADGLRGWGRRAVTLQRPSPRRQLEGHSLEQHRRRSEGVKRRRQSRRMSSF